MSDNKVKVKATVWILDDEHEDEAKDISLYMSYADEYLAFWLTDTKSVDVALTEVARVIAESKSHG